MFSWKYRLEKPVGRVVVSGRSHVACHFRIEWSLMLSSDSSHRYIRIGVSPCCGGSSSKYFGVLVAVVRTPQIALQPKSCSKRDCVNYIYLYAPRTAHSRHVTHYTADSCVPRTVELRLTSRQHPPYVRRAPPQSLLLSRSILLQTLLGLSVWRFRKQDAHTRRETTVLSAAHMSGNLIRIASNSSYDEANEAKTSSFAKY